MCCASLLETVTKNSAAAWRARSSLGLSHLRSLHLTSASLPRACHLVLRDHPRSCYERKFRESSQRRCGGAASVLSLRSSLSHEEARQAVTQVVEPETHLLTFLEYARLHRSRTEIILHRHVGNTGLLPLQPGTGKYPIGRLAGGRLLLPLANEACKQRH